ncbi:MAG: PEGA domain-containing protein [Desulfurococcales archaeon]|nr:PEGA domain-containing protein [Desulfurococcales archaeon]
MINKIRSIIIFIILITMLSPVFILGVSSCHQHLLVYDTVSKANLTIISDPGGAQVYINGSYIGEAPITITLDPGTYNVTVVFPEGARRSEVIILESGEKRTIEFKLYRGIDFITRIIGSFISKVNTALGDMATLALAAGAVAVLGFIGYKGLSLIRGKPRTENLEIKTESREARVSSGTSLVDTYSELIEKYAEAGNYREIDNILNKLLELSGDYRDELEEAIKEFRRTYELTRGKPSPTTIYRIIKILKKIRRKKRGEN